MAVVLRCSFFVLVWDFSPRLDVEEVTELTLVAIAGVSACNKRIVLFTQALDRKHCENGTLDES